MILKLGKLLAEAIVKIGVWLPIAGGVHFMTDPFCFASIVRKAVVSFPISSLALPSFLHIETDCWLNRELFCQ